jgi:hypothetical protein
MQKYFDIIELTDSEAGLVYRKGKLAGALAPARRPLYWKGPIDGRVRLKVGKIDLAADLEVPERAEITATDWELRKPANSPGWPPAFPAKARGAIMGITRAWCGAKNP